MYVAPSTFSVTCSPTTAYTSQTRIYTTMATPRSLSVVEYQPLSMDAGRRTSPAIPQGQLNKVVRFLEIKLERVGYLTPYQLYYRPQRTCHPSNHRCRPQVRVGPTTRRPRHRLGDSMIRHRARWFRSGEGVFQGGGRLDATPDGNGRSERP
jgi:hypothetical protein